jgi:hypothetical protein
VELAGDPVTGDLDVPEEQVHAVHHCVRTGQEGVQKHRAVLTDGLRQVLPRCEHVLSFLAISSFILCVSRFENDGVRIAQKGGWEHRGVLTDGLRLVLRRCEHAVILRFRALVVFVPFLGFVFVA